jgi:hypothetical protein
MIAAAVASALFTMPSSLSLECTVLFRTLAVLAASALVGQSPASLEPNGLAPGSRVRLHAHNCYPQKGLWTDRIERALNTGARPIVIEQDLVWHDGEPVVAHELAAAASAPTLEQHFFARVGPMLDRALSARQTADGRSSCTSMDERGRAPRRRLGLWAMRARWRRQSASPLSRAMPLVPDRCSAHRTRPRPGAVF